MISPQKAKTVILKNTKTLASEKISFMDSRHRVLAQDIKATCDLPPFDRSSMDGYALKSSDIKQARGNNPRTLKIIDTVEAGRPSNKTVKKGEAIKIMTGGVVPEGADCVLMKEYAAQQNNRLLVYRPAKKKENICPKGEDVRKGRTVIKKGTRINAGIVGLLAALGLDAIRVYRKPKVAILVTGSELLSVKQKLKTGKIRSANQYTLFHLVKEAGGEPQIIGIAKDNPPDLKKKIKGGLKSDMLLISGGVSVGDRDLVPGVLRKMGAKIYFWKVAIKPGKPLLFAKIGSTYVFGLPGNPVSTMMSFYNFARECLLKMSGTHDFSFPSSRAILDEDVTDEPTRLKVLRGYAFYRDGDLFVRKSTHQGSGNIISMAKANCVFKMNEGTARLKKGRTVTVHYLPG